MSVNFDYYKMFYFVGKYGSFTQAARVLRNNQPNITRAMNNLEAELGCRLFVRSRKGVTLTPEGEKLFIHVESAYEQIKLGEAELFNRASLQSGDLSVAISEIALHGFMLPILQQYKATYPGIHVQLLNHSTPQGIQAVSRGIAELAVVSTPTGAAKPLSETKIRPFQEILIAGKLYSNLAEKEISLRELASYPLISLGRETTSFAFLNKLFAAQGVVLTPSVEAATTDQILPMVAHDIGLGFVPMDFAREALENGKVVRIRLKETIPPRHISLIKDKSHPLSAAAAALEQIILAAGHTTD
ncbi:MAG: LysR family transcriptional regulator [Lachnospiraceae bacterium]|nr:LysR family transcriptional regulator [Lachnospiraceae bacterium]